MEALKILESVSALNWDYDEGGGRPLHLHRRAEAGGRDGRGGGVIVRYDEAKKEVVGITIVGFRARTLETIAAR